MVEREISSFIEQRELNPEIAVDELRTELFRKSIHILIAFVPLLASWDLGLTVMLLAGGITLYTGAEFLRLKGTNVVVISYVTSIAARKKDEGGFVLGPVTLGLGALLALMLYPAPAATLAIYALAFGDSVSSLAGKTFGRIRIPHTGGKTIVGSFACFVAIYAVGIKITGSVSHALLIAFAGTALEAFPTGDLDNILLPVGTGFIASRLLLLS